jgi:hypothetical protein
MHSKFALDIYGRDDENMIFVHSESLSTLLDNLKSSFKTRAYFSNDKHKQLEITLPGHDSTNPFYCAIEPKQHNYWENSSYFYIQDFDSFSDEIKRN